MFNLNFLSMYNTPVKAYKKVADCQRMDIIINARTKLPPCKSIMS